MGNVCIFLHSESKINKFFIGMYLFIIYSFRMILTRSTVIRSIMGKSEGFFILIKVLGRHPTIFQCYLLGTFMSFAMQNIQRLFIFSHSPQLYKIEELGPILKFFILLIEYCLITEVFIKINIYDMFNNSIHCSMIC